VEEGIALIRRRQTRNWDGWLASALGTLLAQTGDLEGARAAHLEAAERNPTNSAYRLDLADLVWAMGRHGEAAKHYQQALEVDPANAWAAASLPAVRFEETRDPDWLQELVAQAERDPYSTRAPELLTHYGSALPPFFGEYLPDPSDATVNAARQVHAEPPGPTRSGAAERAENPSPSRFSLTLGVPEAPSSLLALRQQLQLLGMDDPPRLTVQQIPKPDPRRPYGRAEYLLWELGGNLLRPALPPGAPAAVEALSALAAQPYSFSGWREKAIGLAVSLRHLRDEEILGVLVHPPLPPAGIPPWRWIYRLDFAAAFVFARFGAGWAGSRRQKLLLSLLNGPMDWTTDAALVALTGVAMDAPELVWEIHELFLRLAEYSPPDARVCWEEVLPWCAMNLPGLPPELREAWRGAPTPGNE